MSHLLPSPFHLTFALCLSCLPFAFHPLPFTLPGLFESPKALPNAFSKVLSKASSSRGCSQVLFLGLALIHFSQKAPPEGFPTLCRQLFKRLKSSPKRLLQSHFQGLPNSFLRAVPEVKGLSKAAPPKGERPFQRLNQGKGCPRKGAGGAAGHICF